MGASEIDGLDALQIDLKRADGSTESWYLDPDTYLEVARVSPARTSDAPCPSAPSTTTSAPWTGS